MTKSEQETTSKSIVRKRRVRRKTYWCAPRRVRSITMIDSVHKNPPVENKKSKKSKKLTIRSKTKHRNRKKLRRIDILALPKTAKITSRHKNRVTNVNDSVWRHPVSKNQKSYICSRKRTRIKKVKTDIKVPEGYKKKLVPKKRHPQIVLPKNLDMRLFSLVKERLKEITNNLKTV